MSKRVCEWSTKKKSYSRNWAGTILVPADHLVAFKNGCLKSGSFDGELRNHFFQGIVAADGRDAVCPDPFLRYDLLYKADDYKQSTCIASYRHMSRPER